MIIVFQRIKKTKSEGYQSATGHDTYILRNIFPSDKIKVIGKHEKLLQLSQNYRDYNGVDWVKLNRNYGKRNTQIPRSKNTQN